MDNQRKYNDLSDSLTPYKMFSESANCNGCQAIKENGSLCRESQSLKIINEIQNLYEDRLRRIDEAGGDGTQLKLKTLKSWVDDLGEQNTMLVQTVEKLEKEAADRVALLEESLQRSSRVALEYMTKLQDYDNQMHEVTGEKVRSESTEIKMTSKLAMAQQTEEILQMRVGNLQNDISCLLELIRRARQYGSWDINGLNFIEVSPEDIFGSYPYQVGVPCDDIGYNPPVLFGGNAHNVSVPYDGKASHITAPNDCGTRHQQADKDEVIKKLTSEIQELQHNQEKTEEEHNAKECMIKDLREQIIQLQDDVTLKDSQIKGFICRIEELRDNISHQSDQALFALEKPLMHDVSTTTEYEDNAEARRFELEAAMWKKRVTSFESELLQAKSDLKHAEDDTVRQQAEILSLTQKLHETEIHLGESLTLRDQLSKEVEVISSKLKEKINEVESLTQTLADAEKSTKDMREALTAEVATKHDQVQALRRDLHILEERCRQADMQTHFKDDIIKEMRKDVKFARAKLALLEGISKDQIQFSNIAHKLVSGTEPLVTETSNYQPYSQTQGKSFLSYPEDQMFNVSDSYEHPSGWDKTIQLHPYQRMMDKKNSSSSQNLWECFDKGPVEKTHQHSSAMRRFSSHEKLARSRNKVLKGQSQPNNVEESTLALTAQNVKCHQMKETTSLSKVDNTPELQQSQASPYRDVEVTNSSTTSRTIAVQFSQQKHHCLQLQAQCRMAKEELKMKDHQIAELEKTLRSVQKNLQKSWDDLEVSSQIEGQNSTIDGLQQCLRNTKDELLQLNAQSTGYELPEVGDRAIGCHIRPEDGQVAFSNMKAEVDYLLHSETAREKQILCMEERIKSLQDVLKEKQHQLQNANNNVMNIIRMSSCIMKEKQKVETVMKEYEHNIEDLKKALVIAKREKQISVEERDEGEVMAIVSDTHQNQKTRKELPDEIDKLFKALQTRDEKIESLEKLNKQLQKMLDEAKEELKKAQRDRNVLQHTPDIVIKKIDEYCGKIMISQAVMVEMKDEIDTFYHSLLSHEEEIAELEKIIQTLQGILLHIQRDVSVFQQETKENRSHRQEIFTDLQISLNKAEVEMKNIQTKADDYEIWQDTCQNIKKSEINVVTPRVSITKAVVDYRGSDVEAAIAIAKLKDEIDTVLWELQMRDQQIAELESNVVLLRDALQCNQETVKDITKETRLKQAQEERDDDLKKDHKIQDLEKALELANEEIKLYQDKLREEIQIPVGKPSVMSSVAEAISYQSKDEEASHNIIRLKTEISRLLNELKSCDEQIAKQDARNKALQAELSDTKDELRTLKRETGLQLMEKQLKDESNMYKRIRELEADLKVAEEEAEMYRKKLMSDPQLHATDNVSIPLQQELFQVQNELRNVKKQFKLEQTQHQMESDFKNRKIAELEEDLRYAQEEVTMYENRIHEELWKAKETPYLKPVMSTIVESVDYKGNDEEVMRNILTLKTEINRLLRELEHRNAEISAQELKTGALQNELHHMKEDMLALKQENRIQLVRKQLGEESQAQRIRELEGGLKSAQEQISIYRDELLQKSQIPLKDTQVLDLQCELLQIQKELRNIKLEQIQKETSNDDKIKELEEKLKLAVVESDMYKEKLGQYESKITDRRPVKSFIMETVIYHGSDPEAHINIMALKAEISRLLDELYLRDAQVSVLDNQLSSLQQRVLHVQQELSSTKKEHMLQLSQKHMECAFKDNKIKELEEDLKFAENINIHWEIQRNTTRKLPLKEEKSIVADVVDYSGMDKKANHNISILKTEILRLLSELNSRTEEISIMQNQLSTSYQEVLTLQQDLQTMRKEHKVKMSEKQTESDFKDNKIQILEGDIEDLKKEQRMYKDKILVLSKELSARPHIKPIRSFVAESVSYRGEDKEVHAIIMILKAEIMRLISEINSFKHQVVKQNITYDSEEMSCIIPPREDMEVKETVSLIQNVSNVTATSTAHKKELQSDIKIAEEDSQQLEANLSLPPFHIASRQSLFRMLASYHGSDNEAKKIIRNLIKEIDGLILELDSRDHQNRLQEETINSIRAALVNAEKEIHLFCKKCQELQERVDSLEKELTQFKEMKVTFNSSSESLKRKVEELEKELTSQMRLNGSHMKMIDNLQEALGSSQAELENVKSKSKDNERKANDNQHNKEKYEENLRAMEKTLHSKNKEIQHQIEHIEELFQMLEKSKTAQSQAEERARDMELQLRLSKEEWFKESREIKKSIQESEDQVNLLKSKLQDNQNEVTNKDAFIRKLQDEVNYTTAELHKMEKKMEACIKEKGEIETVLEERNQQMDSLESRLRRAESEVCSSKSLMSALEAEKENAELLFKKNEELQELVNNFKVEVKTLASALNAKDQIMKDQKEMLRIQQDTLIMTQNEVKDLQERVKKADKLTDEQKRVEEQQVTISNLQQALLSTKQQLEELQGKGSFELKFKDRIIKVLHLDLAEIDSQYRDCYSEVVKKERSLETLRDANVDLSVQAFYLRQEVGFLELRLADTLQTMRIIEALSEDLKNENEQLRKHSRDLEQAMHKLRDHMLRSDAKQSTYSEAAKRNKEVQTEQEKEVSNIQSLRMQNEELKQLNIALKEEAIIAEKQISMQNNRLQELEGLLSTQNQNEENIVLQKECDELTKHNKKMDMEVSKLHSKILEFQHQLHLSEERSGSAQQELHHCRESLQIMQEKIERLKEMLKEKTNQVTHLEINYEATRDDMDALKDVAGIMKTQAQDEISNLKQTVQDLQSRLLISNDNYQRVSEDFQRHQAQLLDSANREVKLQKEFSMKEKFLLDKLHASQTENLKMSDVVDLLHRENQDLKNELTEREGQLQATASKLQSLSQNSAKLQKEMEGKENLLQKLEGGLSRSNLKLLKALEYIQEKDKLIQNLNKEIVITQSEMQQKDQQHFHDISPEEQSSLVEEASHLRAEIRRLLSMQEKAHSEVREYLTVPESWWWDDYWHMW